VGSTGRKEFEVNQRRDLTLRNFSTVHINKFGKIPFSLTPTQNTNSFLLGMFPITFLCDCKFAIHFFSFLVEMCELLFMRILIFAKCKSIKIFKKLSVFVDEVACFMCPVKK
jgi:hypothetical protein